MPDTEKIFALRFVIGLLDIRRRCFLSLKPLDPGGKAVFPGRTQAEFGAGFQNGVHHAVAVAAAAGQQESAATVGRVLKDDDLAGYMAEGALDNSRADNSLAITGIAGPGGGSSVRRCT